MRTLHVFDHKDRLRYGYDKFHQDFGESIVWRTAYRVRMENGEEHMFVIIRDRDDHYKVIGQRFDDIELHDAVPAHTGDFLRSLLLPKEDDILVKQ